MVVLHDVVVGVIFFGLFLGVLEIFFDIVVDLLIQLLGIIADLFPVGVLIVGNVENALASLQLGRDVVHLGAARRQLVYQEQPAVIHVQGLAFLYQIQALRVQHVGFGPVDQGTHAGIRSDCTDLLDFFLGFFLVIAKGRQGQGESENHDEKTGCKLHGKSSTSNFTEAARENKRRPGWGGAPCEPGHAFSGVRRRGNPSCVSPSSGVNRSFRGTLRNCGREPNSRVPRTSFHTNRRSEASYNRGRNHSLRTPGWNTRLGPTPTRDSRAARAARVPKAAVRCARNRIRTLTTRPASAPSFLMATEGYPAAA